MPFEALIPISLFNRANRGKLKIVENDDGTIEIKEDRLDYTSHRHNPEFLLRHVIRCQFCERQLVASKSKGKSGKYFGYYHCNHGHKYWGKNKSEFESTVANYLDSLKAKPGFLPIFREVVRDVWIQKTLGTTQETEQVERHLNDLKARQDHLLDRIAACSSNLVQQKLENQIEELENMIIDLNQKVEKKAIKQDDIDGYFAIAKSLMEHPSQYVFEAQTKEKIEKIWRFIFCTNPSYQDVIDGTPELTLIYRLNQDIELQQNQLAGQLSAQWNTFVNQIEAAID